MAKSAIKPTGKFELTNPVGCIIMDSKGLPERLDIAKTVAWLKENVPIRTVLETKEMLFYHNGIYMSGGEQYASRLLATSFSGINKHNDAPIYTKGVKSEVLSLLRDTTYTEVVDFDADLDIINMKNGLYNWVEGEFLEHSPDYYSMIQIPVVYDPDAVCPNIDKMIQTVADPDNVIKCYEFIAYCLYRTYPIQKLFVLFGPGGTGKTHFMDVVQAVLGDINCSNVSMQDLATDRFATSDLYMKLANICGDLDNTAMKQVAALKQLTSNKDRIRAQKKGEKAFNFVNFAKPIFGANHLPSSTDGTSGFYRRFEIIPFMHVFKKGEIDQVFLDSLTRPSELSGLFNKVVKLLPGLIERNSFTNQLDIEDVQSMYKDRSAPEESFFDQFVSEVPGQFTPKNVLSMHFNEYCKILGLPTKSINLFGRYITGNIDWIKRRAIYDHKDDHKSNYTTTIDGKPVAAWPDTYFDLKAFIGWRKAKTSRI
jgi:putative DNA primase/helicase